jgi:hypothetical protein
VKIEETIAALDRFAPAGEEHESVARLEALVGGLTESGEVKAATPAMLRVFERHPHALLGSPGPLVHCIEQTGIDAFLPLVLASFRRRPNQMTLWMIGRCMRSGLSAQLHFSVASTLREARRDESAADLHGEIDEKLDELGKPRR